MSKANKLSLKDRKESWELMAACCIKDALCASASSRYGTEDTAIYARALYAEAVDELEYKA